MPKRRSRKKDRYTAVLEGLRSDFTVFGEGLDGVRREVGEGFGNVRRELGGLQKGLDGVNVRLDRVQQRGDATFEAVGKLQVDMTVVKDQLSMIRKDLKEKADREELVALEKRVTRLERLVR